MSNQNLPINITLNVNNQNYQLEVFPTETLLEVIREKIGLTGTKEGCGMGECGACTVLLNSQPVCSCLVLAAQCDNAEIKTVEFFGTPDNPSIVQSELVKAGAVQCGFCTPGIVVTSEALLNQQPEASEADIAEALAGNICRCTGYKKIQQAVSSAAEIRRNNQRGEQK